jgi:enolase
MPRIERLTAREILDSRGRPTVEATCVLEGGATATASVPSGASTGSAEALEARDGDRSHFDRLEVRDADPLRYGGLGCRRAVGVVNGIIAPVVERLTFTSQAELDQVMLGLDGTPNKSGLGANAILAVSIAFARACAVERGVPLYQQFADIAGVARPSLPRMTINLFSGGKHAGGQVPIQDVLVVPASARTIDEGLAMTYAVYQAAAELTCRKYNTRALRADEGGLAPPVPDAETMLADAVESIGAAGLVPGKDVALAVDVASSHFFEGGLYDFGGESLDSGGMIDLLCRWLDRYPIVSLEDGLAENAWDQWPLLRERVRGRALVVGDDFLCTNPDRIRRAIKAKAADALLLKVNQIGTLTEAAEALRLAREAGWKVTVSARSGETEDNWLADLAVGWAADQIKVGSITQSERLAKYNRLLAIEAETDLEVVRWPNTS